MDSTVGDPAVFIHVKVAIGMVASLAIASVLTGVARFVQHPIRQKPDSIRLAWALSLRSFDVLG